MADKTFVLEILTPKGRVYSGPVVSLVAPGEIGYLGVLAHHAPLVTTLVPGKLIWRDTDGASRTLATSGEGFLEVRHNTATVLVEEVGEPYTS